MNDVVLEIINRLNGIVTRNHYKVCRVKVNRHSGGMKSIKKFLQHR